MPVMRDDPAARRRRARGFFRRLLSVQRRDAGALVAPHSHVPQARASLVDANTRTFWARGDDAPRTLVEGSAVRNAVPSGRVAALVRAHEDGDQRRGGRPRGNPAFAEAVFVELMRAHQYQRAFAMLSRDCRSAWGTAEAFANAQGGGPMSRLRGVRVLEVRLLGEWVDGAHAVRYRNVAELDVEYAIASESSGTTVQRTVHLVPEDGRWSSLCYPG